MEVKIASVFTDRSETCVKFMIAILPSEVDLTLKGQGREQKEEGDKRPLLGGTA
jgi:hypothetical protein